MSKKTDISKLLTTGSAKQKAILIIYHYNLKEAIDKGANIKEKPPLTDTEAQAIFNSITTPKDIKIYNDYRALNIQIIKQSKWLNILYSRFETEYWKYKYNFLEAKYIHKGKLKGNYFNDIENILIIHYANVLEYYTALSIYIKESGYKDKYIIERIEIFYKILKSSLWDYPIVINGKELIQEISEVEPDENEVKKILKQEFNLEYETEED